MKIDTLFYNGKGRIHWLAVRQGWIQDLVIGKPPKHLLAKKKVNLYGQSIFPGWIDSHVHLCLLGLRRLEINVESCSSLDELFSILKKNISKTSWLEVCGWKGAFLTAEMLDHVSLCIPIVVRRVDEHALWVNSCLLKKVGILKQHPTGFLVDHKIELIEPFRPKRSNEEIEEALCSASDQLLSYGITSVYDMAMEARPLKIVSNLMRLKKINVRVSCALYGKEAFDVFPKPEINLFDHHLNIRAKKIFIDGALGSRGAWLSSPYEDSPGHVGLQLCTERELVRYIRNSLKEGFQLIFHVLGDQASIFVLGVLKKYFSPKEIRDKRFRFEHLEISNSKILKSMKQFGIIASIQPWHIVSDRPWLEKRLGKKRMKQVGIFKEMNKKGLHLCGGSDTPIESHNPLLGMSVAQLPLKKAIELYTVGGAYAEFSQDIKGTLERGKLCDFVVLSHDILAMDRKELPRVKTQMTVVGGKIVYAL